jgi:hypothetical protein
LWKGQNRLLAVEGKPTREGLAHIFIGVFFICSVSDTIFAIIFLQKPPGETTGATGGPRTAC